MQNLFSSSSRSILRLSSTKRVGTTAPFFRQLSQTTPGVPSEVNHSTPDNSTNSTPPPPPTHTVNKDTLRSYKQLSPWKKDTVPAGFQRKHNTKDGIWAKLRMIKGHIEFDMLTEDDKVISQHVFTPTNQPPIIDPQAWHQITKVSDDAECQLEFFCEPQNYFEKKYGMRAAHSEVVEAASFIPPCKALDLGSGEGRNALYLGQLGFSVDACDNNAGSMEKLNQIAAIEGMQDVKGEVRDLNVNQKIDQVYDFIYSTVVFMFLEEDTIPPLISSMQKATKVGGYNLIVSAMDTEDYPCNVGFPFTFDQSELEKYYRQWKIIKYNENVGRLHRVDENGERIKLRFATLLAQKVK